ncbi:type II secretion system F family protein [Ruania halotolerans]|uniref:type II secretion system F family protein n=1 Tax=Ruania halotolerans TaxID=2897773 RepID=UPI001E63B3B3|nr:type II secretion system F family protein [Ruania halotolerans]UFU07136.1 type II secretion system F family protein [Ruania halotolerans]
MVMHAGSAVLIVVLATLALVPWALPRPPQDYPDAVSPDHGAHGKKVHGKWGRGGASSARPARRSAAQVDEAVLLDLAGASLSSGASVPAVIEALGHALDEELADPLLRAVAALRLGAPWDEAWQNGRIPVQVESLRDALGPAWRDGVDPAPLLAQAAVTIRARRGSRAREAAARLGVRLVLPLGLCLLPAFVLLGLAPVLLSTGMNLFGW